MGAPCCHPVSQPPLPAPPQNEHSAKKNPRARPQSLPAAQFITGSVEEPRRHGARFRDDIVTGVGGRQVLLQDPSGNPVQPFEPTRPEARLSAA
jgi:hypothetical protein